MTCVRLLILAATLCACAGAASGADGASWRFVPGEPHVYLYSVQNQTSFESAGDKLSYTSSFSWKLVLARHDAPEDGGRITLGVSILRITASLDGPASHHAIDTDAPSSEARHDPLFGHLFDLNGAGFVLRLDPLTGAVSSVTGGEQVAARIATSEPSAFADDEASPLEAAAKAAYSSQALSAVFSQMMALPVGGSQNVPLTAPLTGSLIRTWNGGQYSLALPAGISTLPITLGTGPLAVTGTLSEVAGQGNVAPHLGIPGTADGHLSFTLTLTALTQPVVEHQVLTWIMHEVQP